MTQATRFHLILLSFLFLSSVTLFAQSTEVQDRITTSIGIIDRGNLDSAWSYLEASRKLYPDVSFFRYAEGYIMILRGRHVQAAAVFEEIIEKPDRTSQYFQMLARSYDTAGQRGKAIESLRHGVTVFPQDGPLYEDLGNLYMREALKGTKVDTRTFFAALQTWEKGIEEDPDYSPNYYLAAENYSYLSDIGWGVLLGESYIAMQPVTPRADTMRRLNWLNYRRAFEKGTPFADSALLFFNSFPATTPRLGLLFSRAGMMIDSSSGHVEMYVPFTSAVDNTLLQIINRHYRSGTQLTVANLYAIRKDFLKEWQQQKPLSSNFNNALFAFWSELEKAGVFEAFTYLTVYSNEIDSEIKAWVESHDDAMAKLVPYLTEKGIRTINAPPPIRTTMKPLNLKEILGQ